MKSMVARLIDRQLRLWEENPRTGPYPSPAEAAPIVAISRESGAGGIAVAKLTAEELGYPYWDKELTEELATDQELETRSLQALSDEARAQIDAQVDRMLTENGLAKTEYLASMARALLCIRFHGPAVLLGRGVNFLLPPPRVLAVRLVAPLSDRVRLTAGLLGLDNEAEALAEVQRRDVMRGEFARRTFGVDVADPHHYDVVINTGRMPLERAAELIVSIFRQRFGSWQRG